MIQKDNDGLIFSKKLKEIINNDKCNLLCIFYTQEDVKGTLLLSQVPKNLLTEMLISYIEFLNQKIEFKRKNLN